MKCASLKAVETAPYVVPSVMRGGGARWAHGIQCVTCALVVPCIAQVSEGEICDDGGRSFHDGCSPACTLEVTHGSCNFGKGGNYCECDAEPTLLGHAPVAVTSTVTAVGYSHMLVRVAQPTLVADRQHSVSVKIGVPGTAVGDMCTVPQPDHCDRTHDWAWDKCSMACEFVVAVAELAEACAQLEFRPLGFPGREAAGVHVATEVNTTDVAIHATMPTVVDLVTTTHTSTAVPFVTGEVVPENNDASSSPTTDPAKGSSCVSLLGSRAGLSWAGLPLCLPGRRPLCRPGFALGGTVSQNADSIRRCFTVPAASSPMPWHSAVAVCANLDATLATVSSVVENGVVHRLLANYTGEHILGWLGLNSLQPLNANAYAWVDSSPAHSFSHWATRAPDGSCATVSSDSGLWLHTACNASALPVCMVPVGKSNAHVVTVYRGAIVVRASLRLCTL